MEVFGSMFCWFWSAIVIDHVFSIKCPRRLFQTWHGGPGVSLNQQVIWACHFFKKGFYLFFLAAMYLALYLALYLVIQQINVWGAYLQFPLLYPAFIRGSAFNQENTVT